MLRACSLGLALLLTTGCAQIVGIEEWGSGGAGGAAMSATAVNASSSSGGGCSRCVPFAPAGWNGPLFISADGAPCDAPSQSPFVAHDGLQVPDVCHGCVCEGDPSNCASVTFAHGTSATCGTKVDLPPAQCVDLPASFSAVSAGPPGVKATGCVTSNQSAPVPDAATWDKSFTACTPPPPESTNSTCGTQQTCFPDDPGAGAVCVYKYGADKACVGEYSVHQVIYTDLFDGRTCASCGCDKQTAAGVQCAGSVEIFATPGCDGSAALGIETGAPCVTIAAQSIAFARYSPASVGMCGASTVKTAGSAQPSGPITICCLE